MWEINNITLTYDKEIDVLYISFDQPTPAISEEFDGVLVRRDIVTKEIVGLTILDFKARIE